MYSINDQRYMASINKVFSVFQYAHDLLTSVSLSIVSKQPNMKSMSQIVTSLRELVARKSGLIRSRLTSPERGSRHRFTVVDGLVTSRTDEVCRFRIVTIVEKCQVGKIRRYP